jgi:acyl dehydratase
MVVFFEDIMVGDCVSGGPYPVSAEEIISFAERYDPQPFHLSDEGAANTPFGTLAASGWHTGAMAMAMLVRSWQEVPGRQDASLGAMGIDELRWHQPVRAGDVLRFESEVIEKIDSRSKPKIGIVRTRTTIFNQHDQAVMSFIPIAMWRKRPAT